MYVFMYSIINIMFGCHCVYQGCKLCHGCHLCITMHIKVRLQYTIINVMKAHY